MFLRENLRKQVKKREVANKNIPMSRNLWTKIKKKQRLWERMKQIKATEEERFVGEFLKVQEEYRRTNNQVRGATRLERRKQERKIAKCVRDNPKLFWKYVQSQTKCASGVPELYKDADKKLKTKGDEEKVEVLSDCYNKVFTDEPEGDVPVVETKTRDRCTIGY